MLFIFISSKLKNNNDPNNKGMGFCVLVGNVEIIIVEPKK